MRCNSSIGRFFENKFDIHKLLDFTRSIYGDLVFPRAAFMLYRHFSINPNERGDNMFRYLLSSRLIQVGFVFCVLVVGGSLLYSWHVRRTTEKDMEQYSRFSRGLEKQNETRPAEIVSVPTESQPPGFMDTPDENTGTLMSDETEAETIDATEFGDIADAFLPDNIVSDEVPAAEVPVSPFGFGPYPDIPEGYPLIASWTRIGEHREKFNDNIWRDLELMGRVLIKLYNEGDTSFTAGIVNDGLVLPIYPNVAYARIEKDEDWKSTADPLIDVRSDSSRILAGNNVS